LVLDASVADGAELTEALDADLITTGDAVIGDIGLADTVAAGALAAQLLAWAWEQSLEWLLRCVSTMHTSDVWVKMEPAAARVHVLQVH
jgi:hypothetical protein